LRRVSEILLNDNLIDRKYDHLGQK
jgi:hypothetical protein